jgi:hypothetical protein
MQIVMSLTAHSARDPMTVKWTVGIPSRIGIAARECFAVFSRFGEALFAKGMRTREELERAASSFRPGESPGNGLRAISCIAFSLLPPSA